MATREENLKKINNDLELLSDDELEQVAGGSAFVTEKGTIFGYGNILNGTLAGMENAINVQVTNDGIVIDSKLIHNSNANEPI